MYMVDVQCTSGKTIEKIGRISDVQPFFRVGLFVSKGGVFCRSYVSYGSLSLPLKQLALWYISIFFIRIDSFLQTRIIHNLRLIDKANEKIDRNGYNADLSDLATLFHKRQFDLISNFQAERQKETEKFAGFETTFTRDSYEWATAALNDENSQAELFLQIKNKISGAYENI